MKILILGDIMGSSGRNVLSKKLPGIIIKYKVDFVIACRGTEPTQFNDIKADLNAIPTKSETVSYVHSGFKEEVDKIWPRLVDDISREAGTRTVWFCGHSLGAAMATIVASRCTGSKECPDPAELYTYGSPRVGFKKYVSFY